MFPGAALRSMLRAHPYLAVYAAVLLLAWLITASTWTIRPGEPLHLHPLAQGLQYVLAITAATLAAVRQRIEHPDSRSEATFGFYDYRWTMSDGVGSQSFWTAVWVGAVAMTANIGVLILFDLLLAGGQNAGAYLGWARGAIAAGAVSGSVGAVVAALVSAPFRRRTAAPRTAG